MNINLVSGSATKTAVWEYGFKPDTGAVKLLHEQFFKATKLYNACIAFIRATSTAAREFIFSAAGEDAVNMGNRLLQLDIDFLAARTADNEPLMIEIKKEQKGQYALLKPLLKAARLEHKQYLSDAFYSHLNYKAGGKLHAIVEAAKADGLGADTAVSIVKDALKAYSDSIPRGGMPKFKRFSDMRKWTLTIGAHRGGGVDINEINQGKYKPCIIGNKRHDGTNELSYRIGAAADKVWATGTIIMHRPLPKSGGAAEVVLKCQRVGVQMRYWVQFVMVDLPEPEQVEKKKALCTLHMGWSKHDDGRIVAAIGTSKHADDAVLIHLPERVTDTLRFANEAQAARDLIFNREWPHIKERLKSIKVVNDEKLEAEIEAITKLATTHVAESRLRRLIDRIKVNNDYSDPMLSAWAKLDRRYCMRIAGGQRKAQMQRRYYYRELAAKYANEYETVVITDLDLKEAALKVNDDGEKTEFSKEARSGRVTASISTLREAFENAFAARGGIVLESNEEVTKHCSECGSYDFVDSTVSPMQAQDCNNCGEHFESRKQNAAANLWALVSGVDDMASASREEAAKKATEAYEKKKEKSAKMQAAAREKRLQSKT